MELSVNPNTIQKALSELEREGFLITERAVGRYVSDNIELIEEYKNMEIKKKIEVFIEDMKSLGVSVDEILRFIDEFKEEDYE